MVTEVENFLADMLPRQVAAERALHQGDSDARRDTWSTRDPVTLFGVWGPLRSGAEELRATMRWLTARFSRSTDFRFDVVAADVSGDLAYTVGYEHNNVEVDGKPTNYTLRVTHVYRRENGTWKVVHRHANQSPDDQDAGEPL